MHRALYRKWRPATFDDVCGQEHITSVLKYEVENNKLSHAYLFCGSRGTGKTTCAKILAKAVNCEHPVNGSPCGVCDACRAIDAGAATDVVEMDAASNNGVENIRDIRDEVGYVPSALKYKVYIIDEVHMLSISAFNALLKTLEEPPEHVVFILATTERRKLPATIISRCQHFEFRRIATDVLCRRIEYIAEQEGIELDHDAALVLSKQAQGGMRDAISLLELCAGTRQRITEEYANEAVGSGGRGSMCRMLRAIADRDYDKIFGEVDEVVRSSRDIVIFWQDLISIYRDMLVVKTVKNYAAYLDLTDSEASEMAELAAMFTYETISYHCRILEEALGGMMRANAVRRIVAEMALVRMCDKRLSSTPEAMLARISELERQIKNGVATAPATEQTNKDNTDDTEPHPTSPAQESAESTRKTESGRDQTAMPSTEEKKENDTRRSFSISDRAEIMEKMSSIDRGITVPYYNSAKWYIDGDRIIIKMAKEYDIDLVRSIGGDKNFHKALCEVTGKKIPESNIVYEASYEGEDEPIDDIIDSMKE